MFNLSKQIKIWFSTYSESYNSVFSVNEDRKRLQKGQIPELFQERTQHLITEIKDLPSPPAYQQAVQEALVSALKPWSEQPSVYPNSLVFLSSPIESTSQFLKKSLKDWKNREQIPLKFLEWNTRPEDFSTTAEKLLTQLKREEEYQEILILPNLNLFFLRCVEGFESIKIIRDMVLKDRSRFWVIGAPRWAWQYLNLGFRIETYFNQSLRLPTLTGKQLQEWLTPVFAQANTNFIQQQEQKEYFEELADMSRGISIVAAWLFFNSLKHEVIDSESDREKATVEIEKLSVPDLPNLPFNEQYILFSLLLHGGLSLSHLCYALGELENNVQESVQFLYRAGAIQRQDELLLVHPVFYTQIRDLLDFSDFLIVENE